MSMHVKVIEDALPAALCAKLIARFNGDERVAPDPQPDYSTRSYLHISQYGDWRAECAEVCRFVNRAVADYFSRPPHLAHGTYHEWSDDGYVVSRYRPGDDLVLHIDGQTAVEPHNTLRIATLIFYLNDVAEGGETYFPLQDLRVAPRQGRAVLFPVGFTHPHEVGPAKTDRYILQSWITDPNFLVISG